MKPVPLAVLLLLAACAGTDPYAPVQSIRYAALGQDPFWTVTIGDDRIVLALSPSDGGEGVARHDFPRTLPRRTGETRIWESQADGAVIGVETRPGPCVGSGGLAFADHVRVRLSGRELTGCGGPLVSGRRG